MSKKIASLVLSFTLILAAASVYLYTELRAARSGDLKAEADREVLARRLAGQESEIAELRRWLERSRERESHLESRLRKRGADIEEGSSSTSEGTKLPSAPAQEVGELGTSLLSSPEEAGARAREFLLKGDIEGLWLLGADLLALGEDGYEKIIALAGLLDTIEKDQAISMLWRTEHFVGPLLRAASEHDEDLLRFSLYLDSRDSKTLPKILRGFQKELTGDMGPVLLGFYDGDDPEIHDGYLDMYRRHLSGDLQKNRNVDEMLAGMGQIRSEESTDLILEVIERLPDNRNLEHAVRALTWQGSDRALPVLRTLLENTNDPKLSQLIAQAVRYLE